MTRIEALRILTRYMPQRSIHITESLDSNFIDGDRCDSNCAMITISPGISGTMPDCFIEPTVEQAVKRVFEARETQRDAEDNTKRAESFADMASWDDPGSITRHRRPVGIETSL